MKNVKTNHYLKFFQAIILTTSFLLLLASSAYSQKHKKKNHHAIQYGIASYYSKNFQGDTTASGEIFDNRKLTAANNIFPLGTYVKVTNVHNKHYVIVKINDRLNYKNPRLIDLTQAAAKKLGFRKRGIVKVRLEVIPQKMATALHLDALDSVVIKK